MEFFRTVWLVVSLFLGVGLAAVQAQVSTDDPQPSREQRLSNLWFGGQFQLGFNSGFGTSIFQLGIAPMVGYKLTPSLSAGPRANLVVNHIRVRNNSGGTDGFTPITWGVGTFGRFKIIRQIFLQAEYMYESEVVDYDANLDAIRRNRGNIYLGGGYSMGGGGPVATEIVLLYRANQPETVFINESPLDIRVGFTYNF